jgi:general secretion pathway protein G
MRLHSPGGGFTLIEIMLVVVIIGLLAAVVTPKLMGNLAKGQVAATRASIKNLETAIDQYQLDHSGRLPNSLQDVLPYLRNQKSVPKDAWGMEFAYTPNHADGSFSIVSAGPDNLMGTADDITN